MQSIFQSKILEDIFYLNVKFDFKKIQLLNFIIIDQMKIQIWFLDCISYFWSLWYKPISLSNLILK